MVSTEQREPGRDLREAVAARVGWEIGPEWGGGDQGLGCLQGEETSEMLQDTEEGGRGFASRPWGCTGGQVPYVPTWN